ncbi:hypothetical protein CEQ90_17210 [Lewinellaceae bacterium SD302]|nr:hypothetical protein CEQ90_17210 [Lewinellaceae bacterium SD302]
MAWPALLIQLVLYMGLMVVDDYAGGLLAIILGAICFSVWGISHLVELIQPSRVKKTYYRLMLTGWVAPAIAFIAILLLKGGFDWLR